MSDQTKLIVHFIVSKLVILAVPILNQLLAVFGIPVNTSNSTADALANCLCIGIGLAYSGWLQRRTATVAHAAGIAKGIATATSTVDQTTASPSA